MPGYANGPSGLESPHQLAYPGGSTIVMHNRQSVGLPCIHFDRMPGFRSMPEMEDLRAPRTAQVGEVAYPSVPRGKTFTVEGRLMGTTMDEVRVLEAQLKTVLVGDGLGKELTWTVLDGFNWGALVRLLHLDIDEEWKFSPRNVWGPYQLTFIMGFRMGDPRWTSGTGGVVRY